VVGGLSSLKAIIVARSTIEPEHLPPRFDNPGMEDNQPNSRRWFRFSLRTMFVLVTVFCVWLGYSGKWVKQRREFIKAHPNCRAPIPAGKVLPSAPSLLWIWGEKGEFEIYVQSPGFANEKNKDYHHKNPPREAVEARELFPEAAIAVLEGNLVWNTWFPGKEWEW
jgi:hypothetical protein